MVIVCWAAKGGSGTTVVVAGIGLGRSSPTLIVDLRGDLPAALGATGADRQGVGDWLATDVPARHLGDLVVELAPDRHLLPWGSIDPAGPHAPTIGDDRWTTLAAWLGDWRRGLGTVVVDAGTGDPPAPLIAEAQHRLLVTRPCYLSLVRALRGVARPTAVVVVEEPWRSYRVRDIESAIGAPVGAIVKHDPALARAVDAGLLLAGRSPVHMIRQLRDVAA